MEPTTTELVTASEAAKRLPGLSISRIRIWRQTGMLTGIHPRAGKADLYSLAELERIMSQPKEQRLARIRACTSKGRPRVRCCTVCGRDTRRWDGMCRHCIGEFDRAA